MDEEEINNTISEFMGMYYITDGANPFVSDQITGHHWATCIKPFTQSLDALIPVVEKLNLAWSLYFFTDTEKDQLQYKAYLDKCLPSKCDSCGHSDYSMAESETVTPALSLATVCARVIKDSNS